MKSFLLALVLVTSTSYASLSPGYMDLRSNQTIAGVKTFSSQIVGSVSGSSGSVTTIPSLSGDVTSSGNAVSIGAAKVTNAMLAGSIDLSTKVTNRLPKASAPLREVPSSDMPSVKTANYTIGANDYFIRYDSHGGAFNIQLPDPTLGRRELKFIDVRAGEGDSMGVNLVPYSSEKIGGIAGTKNLPAQFTQTSLGLTSDLVDWWVDGITF